MFVMGETWARFIDVGKQRRREKERRFCISKVGGRDGIQGTGRDINLGLEEGQPFQ